MSRGPLLSCTRVCKSFRSGDESVEVLSEICLDVAPGNVVVIQGVSGSGKSTLLQILGGLMTPDAGKIELDGEDYSGMSDRRLCAARNRKLGFVYQAHHLMGEFNALENVAMPLFVRRIGTAHALERARRLLDQVGLLGFAGKPPAKLSGGERQRVAVARALAGAPECVIADEPTGSLDRMNADKVFALLLELCASRGAALVAATHDDRIAHMASSRYVLAHGRLQEKA